MEKKEQILQLIEQKRFSEARMLLEDEHPADIAQMLDEMDAAQGCRTFRLLPKSLAADVFSYLDSDNQQRLITLLSDAELSRVLDEMYMDDTVDMLEELPASVVKRILQLSHPDTRSEINRLCRYEEDTAGSIMTTEMIDLKRSMTVKDAFDLIRRVGTDMETIYTCYVTDERRVLEGVVTVRDLLLHPYEAKVEDLMDEDPLSVQTGDDQETIAQIFQKYDILTLPVVDSEKRLVGIITIDDAVDVIQEENTEDIEKMAAILPSDKPYLKTSIFDLWKRRIPWLLLLMISATFTGNIITSFEDKLSKYIVLTAYIPMLMDTGGNCGSQASTTIIRGLSLGEVQFRDIFRVIWKEIRVAVLCSSTLAVCNFVKLMLIDRLQMMVALTICVTLIITVCSAKIVGCTLPLLAKKLGFDPAVMASPFITTIVDAISLLVYFGFATIILHI
ncbi:MAG TPA: magnesium transporter [Candidatus Faecivivens stercoripullorum]|uniref:Magnesium transporter MgtE n=1 Tax=Candidatus Faecivivens stercoripullorum TaxID=2840805 RepID=A0A9D1H616_9FIRM|nr:magnesium transporter [Candidatus Faecivivens stercoripullorum]